MKFSLALFASLVAVVTAASNTATCGNTVYKSDALDKAADASCSMVKKGTSVGTNRYPHQYKNLEKFKLSGLTGPFYEFPILSNGQVYSGGSPGADRIITTQDCKQAGVLTHQGASGNAFRECSVKTSAAAPVVDAQLAFMSCFTMTIFALAL
ncbi:hypothetical protein QQS21_002311 [Conoideocrella luteorostrata]|uniref:ribonuclease T1 n=1 Tax=Conoideocrella luteorostrata TaxID=1105319 RepID=A0AAJ0CXV0_9HYPO|nr:hypothetical protein QQS21_002311 [Conoideocrella luteorostrata]